jgi:predicted phosphodiesterase
MSASIAFLSDIHGNSPALKAVLEDIERVGCSKVFMLGDLINGFDPGGCVQILRQWVESTRVELDCIKGNAEAYLLTPDRAHLPRQDEDWNTDVMGLVDWWEARLTKEDLAWIRTFQDYIFWEDACLVHDRPMDRLTPESWHLPDIEPKYQEWFFHSPGIKPNMKEADWQTLWSFMEMRGYLHVFCGHTHIPFYREHNGRHVCNTGSVGVPQDGDPRPSWVLVAQRPNAGLDISIRRVEYDVELIQRIVDETPDYYDFKIPGYQEAYKKWLATGIIWREHLR